MKVFSCVAAPILLAALLLPAPAAVAGPRLQRCDLGLQRPLRCGRVVVPMRRGDPALGTTEVAFALRARADRERPSLGTIVAIDGGPGYASTDAPFARSLAAVLAPLLRRHDLVLFDERGTGRSQVVDCPDLQAGLTPEAVAVGECANRLGPRYAGYTTAEAAHDLEAVRTAVGLGKVFLYGDSYGTLFGQAYAARYPTRYAASSSTPPTPPTTLITARSCRRGSTGCGSPAGTRRAAMAIRSPASFASSTASTPPIARPRACSTSSCRRGRWRRAPSSASTKPIAVSLPANRDGCSN